MPNKFSPMQSLRAAGFRVTLGRLEVLELLAKAPVPLTTSAILSRLKQKTLDQATVYRMLTAMREKGLVQAVNMEQDRAYWEIAHHHHHAVCEKCGRTVDISSCDLSSLEKQVKKISGFSQIHRHSLEFFGLCKKCQKNQPTKG